MAACRIWVRCASLPASEGGNFSVGFIGIWGVEGEIHFCTFPMPKAEFAGQ